MAFGIIGEYDQPTYGAGLLDTTPTVANPSSAVQDYLANYQALNEAFRVKPSTYQRWGWTPDEEEEASNGGLLSGDFSQIPEQVRDVSGRNDVTGRTGKSASGEFDLGLSLNPEDYGTIGGILGAITGVPVIGAGLGSYMGARELESEYENIPAEYQPEFSALDDFINTATFGFGGEGLADQKTKNAYGVAAETMADAGLTGLGGVGGFGTGANALGNVKGATRSPVSVRDLPPDALRAAATLQAFDGWGARPAINPKAVSVRNLGVTPVESYRATANEVEAAAARELANRQAIAAEVARGDRPDRSRDVGNAQGVGGGFRGGAYSGKAGR